MNIKQIECFIAVSKTLSFTQASEQLFMSQPTVSRLIRNLEDDLGLTLFFRNTNSVHLTPAGLVMLQTYTEILDFIQNQKNLAKKLSLGEQGIIHLGFLTKTDVIHHFSDIFNIFQQLYPNIELIYHFANHEILEQQLKKKEMDAVFIPDFASYKNEDIVTEPIFKTNARLVYGINHPLAQKENLAFPDFKNEVFFSAFPKDIVNKLWEKIFSYYGISVWKNKNIPSFDSGLLKIYMGEGVTILDPVAGSIDKKHYKFLTLPDEVSTVNICVSWLRNNFNTSLPLLLNILTNPDYGRKLLKGKSCK